MNSCMFSFRFKLIFILVNSKYSFSSSSIMDFHKAIYIDSSEPDKLLKTFIFMSAVVILYILRIFAVQQNIATPFLADKQEYMYK